MGVIDAHNTHKNYCVNKDYAPPHLRHAMRIRIDTAMTLADILRGLERGGMTQAAVAKRLKVSQPTVSRWLNGSEPKTRHRDKLLQLAIDKGVISEGENIANNGVPIVGYVGTGGAIDFSQGPLGEATVPPKTSRKHTVAVRVRGNSMSPQLEDGWTVYYDERRGRPTDDMIGKTCVVGLTDGRVLIKKLHRGNDGSFVLASLEPSQAPITGPSIAWAARVTFFEQR